MRLRQYLLVGFTSALTVMLTGRASFAFNIIPPQPGATSNWRPVSRYLIDGLEGRTEVDTGLWTDGIESVKKVDGGNLLSYHIIARPHENLDYVLPIGYTPEVEQFRM